MIEFSMCSILQINIIINQITGVTNRSADLLGVRFAGINQILDPWLYVLLRKALILKIVKYLHWKICRRSKTDGSGRRVFHSYENVPVDREQISLGQLDDLQIKVLCVTVDNRPCDHDRCNENESSDESMSSVSNLISHQHIDMGYHSNSSERESAMIRSNDSRRKGETLSDRGLSRSSKEGGEKKKTLKRNHSSPAFASGNHLKVQTKIESNSNTSNEASVITI